MLRLLQVALLGFVGLSLGCGESKCTPAKDSAAPPTAKPGKAPTPPPMQPMPK